MVVGLVIKKGGLRMLAPSSCRYWGKYAASNDLVVLYPFAQQCWDTVGDTGENYATKEAIQPKAIMAMIARLIE